MDIVCKCGHVRKVHLADKDDPSSDLVCYIKGRRETLLDDCPCYNYVPDNLLHIERLAKERNLL